MAGEDSPGCLSDQPPLLVAAHAPPQLAGRPSLLGQLKVLAPDPPAAVLGLLASHGADDARRQPPVWGREVVVASGNYGQEDCRVCSTRSMKVSSSLGERWRRSLCQVTMASIRRDSTAASICSYAGRRLPLDAEWSLSSYSSAAWQPLVRQYSSQFARCRSRRT